MTVAIVAAALAIVMTIAGLVWNAARSFERLEGLREDVHGLTRDVRELRDLLYTTVGGRRKIWPVETADNGPKKDD